MRPAKDRNRDLGESEVFDPPGSTLHNLFIFTTPVQETWGGTHRLSCSGGAYVIYYSSAPGRFGVVVWSAREGHLIEGRIRPSFARSPTTDSGRGVEKIEKAPRSYRV
jgi:hypothetical protein